MEKLHVLAIGNAKELRRLNDRIEETLRNRSASPTGRAEWSAACAEFHERFNDLFFPGGDEAWAGFLQGRVGYIEHALAFLEADQWSFRSGYHKQIVWRRFKRLLLSKDELDRLEQAALSYLPKRVRWEFWHMAKFVCLRGSETFWQRVEGLASSAERSPSAIKANWLLLTRANVPVRSLVGHELLRAKYQPGYTPALDLPGPRRET